MISPSGVNKFAEWYYQRLCAILFCRRCYIFFAQPFFLYTFSITFNAPSILTIKKHSVLLALAMGQNTSRQQIGGSFSKPPLPPRYSQIFGRSSSEALVQHRDEHEASILLNEDWRHSETLPSYEPCLRDEDGTSSAAAAAAAAPPDDAPPRYKTLHPECQTITHRKGLSRFLGTRLRRGTKRSAVTPPRVPSQRQNATARPSIPERVSSQNSRSSVGQLRSTSEVVEVSLPQTQRTPYAGEDPSSGAAAHRQRFRDLHVQDLQHMRDDHALASQL